MIGLRESLLRSFLGQLDGMISAADATVEDFATDRDIADDMAALIAGLLRTKHALLRRNRPVGYAPQGNVGSLEDGTHSFKDPDGDVSSSFHVDRDFGDESEAA